MASPDRVVPIEEYRRRARSDDALKWTNRVDAVLRAPAVARLRLKPGDVVLDVACGSGRSFPLIQEAIGPQGRLIGVEVNPESLREAEASVARNRWKNVDLIEAPVERAELPMPPDAAVFVLTHEVMRSEAAVGNVFRQLKPWARVAAAGERWAPWWAVPVNLSVWWSARRYLTTFEGLGRPWGHLDRFVRDLQVESVLFGGGYIAWGTFGAESRDA